MRFKNLLLVGGFSVAMLGCQSAVQVESSSKQDENWEYLFNGKDLSGWTAHFVAHQKEGDDVNALFNVVNNEIHVYPTAENKSAQPFAVIETQASFQDYWFSLEYKWGEGKYQPRVEKLKDAGILYHTHGYGHFGWPLSMEYQIQTTDTGDSYGIGTHYGAIVDGEWKEKGDPKRIVGIRHNEMWEVDGWNKVDVLVRGDKAQHIINGKLVMEISNFKKWDADLNQWVLLDKGQIALQAEGAEVFYRNIKIRPLTDQDPI